MARKSTRKPELKIKQISHPNSRKAKQLVRKTNRVAKRVKSKVGFQMRVNMLGEKMLYFRDNLHSDTSVCSPTQLSELIEKYLSRFSDELEQIKLKHSIGQRNRQHASREDSIKMTIDQELEEYNTCGIELPDLLNEAQVKMLREWNGEIRFIQNFKLRRFSKTFLSSCKDKKPDVQQSDSDEEMTD